MVSTSTSFSDKSAHKNGRGAPIPCRRRLHMSSNMISTARLHRRWSTYHVHTMSGVGRANSAAISFRQTGLNTPTSKSGLNEGFVMTMVVSCEKVTTNVTDPDAPEQDGSITVCTLCKPVPKPPAHVNNYIRQGITTKTCFQTYRTEQMVTQQDFSASGQVINIKIIGCSRRSWP